MIEIVSVHARQILDSRGFPTVECDVRLSDGAFGRAAVPSGASTGSREALELRDGGSAWEGKGVTQAVEHINQRLSMVLRQIDPFDQAAVDMALQSADGTPNKQHFGANSLLALSLAVAKACAASSGIAFHEYVSATWPSDLPASLPLPMMNVMNGGQHARGATDFQEYMIVPVGAKNWQHVLQMGTAVFHQLGNLLAADGHATTVGDEGGYAPSLPGGNRAPLDYIMRAILQAGFTPGRDMAIAIDVAASEFFEQSVYHLATEQRQLDGQQMVDYLAQLTREYPIVSIEDGLDENDWRHWQILTAQLGETVQLVGDDLLVTNTELLERAMHEQAANAILLKPNQIGTLSETVAAARMAQSKGWRTIVSHRSGETEDTTIAHLAVGLGAGQIKTGSLSRTERIAKYNEITRIAEAHPNLKLAQPYGAG